MPSRSPPRASRRDALCWQSIDHDISRSSAARWPMSRRRRRCARNSSAPSRPQRRRGCRRSDARPVGARGAAAREGLPPLVRALDAPSARLRERITYALAGSPAGAQLLIDAIRAGRLPAQAVADPTLRERLVAGKPDAIRAAVTELARADSSLEAARRGRIDEITRR